MTGRYSLTFGILFAGSLLSQAAENPEADILGRVGEEVVSIDDVRASLSSLAPQDRETAGKDPALMNKLVRSLLVQNIVLQEAQAQKWEQEPAVAAQLARVRETAITESYLQSKCAPPESYPNDTELQAAYEAAKPSLLVPRTYHLAQIFITDPKTGAAAGLPARSVSERVTTVQKALKVSGADFTALAGTHSDERESAGRGGDLGWLAETQIQPEIRTRLTSVKLNAVTDPIRLDDGWHILKVLDIREPFTATLEQVKPRLVQQLRAERTKANTQEYLARLLQENPIAINELALTKILPTPKSK